MAIVGSSLARRPLDRAGLRVGLIASGMIAAAGKAGLATSLHPGTSLVVHVAWTLILGIGQAMGFTSLHAAAGAGIAPERQGVASATMTTGPAIDP